MGIQKQNRHGQPELTAPKHEDGLPEDPGIFMVKRPGSLSARLVAAYREIESNKPEGERIFYDPFAGFFAGEEGRKLAERTESIAPGGYLTNVMSSWFTEEWVKQCISKEEDAVEQVVIWGAGYDSMALRVEALQKGIKVYEVDEPVTSMDKRERVKEVVGSLPAHIRYITMDFERESYEDLKNKLLSNDYNPSGLTVFTLRGVLQYLTPEAVDALFNFTAQFSGPGSSIVFNNIDFNREEWALIRDLTQELSSVGEPWKFGLRKERIESFMEQRGYKNIHVISMTELKERLNKPTFLADSFYYMVTAIVK